MLLISINIEMNMELGTEIIENVGVADNRKEFVGRVPINHKQLMDTMEKQALDDLQQGSAEEASVHTHMFVRSTMLSS